MTPFGTFFTGFGGVDIGMMADGLTPLWGVEYDADIAGVYRRNLGDHIIVGDVRAMDYTALPLVDWLHASPSCVRASVANPDAGEAPEDIEAAQAVVRAIQAQRPQVFTLENVWGYRNFKAFRLILDALGAAGYMYDFEHVNCADFGAPQTRRRLILRAVYGALLPALPEPVPWVGWYAAIEDLIPTLPDSQLAPWQMARLSGELRALLISNAKTEYGVGMANAGDPVWSVTSNTLGRSRAVLVGSGNTQIASITDKPRAQDAPCYTVHPAQLRNTKAVLVKGDDNSGEFGVVTADAGDPAFSVRAGRSTQHRASLPDVARVVAMTPRCLARFQSFPDTYALPDKRTLAAKGIGNAVPPLVMQRIAEQLVTR